MRLNYSGIQDKRIETSHAIRMTLGQINAIGGHVFHLAGVSSSERGRNADLDVSAMCGDAIKFARWGRLINTSTQLVGTANRVGGGQPWINDGQ